MCYQWGQELREQGKEDFTVPFLGRSITVCIRRKKVYRKKVLIIENFHYLLKGDTFFLQELIRYLKEHRELSLLVILTTYAYGWVENSMISKIGNLAFFCQWFSEGQRAAFFSNAPDFPRWDASEEHRTLCGVRRNAGIMETVGTVSFCGGESDDAFFRKKPVFFRN